VSGETFAEYWPAKVLLGTSRIQTLLWRTASLAGVLPPHLTFRLKIAGETDPAAADEEALAETWPPPTLSCLQLEAVTVRCASATSSFWTGGSPLQGSCLATVLGWGRGDWWLGSSQRIGCVGEGGMSGCPSNRTGKLERGARRPGHG